MKSFVILRPSLCRGSIVLTRVQQCTCFITGLKSLKGSLSVQKFGMSDSLAVFILEDV